MNESPIGTRLDPKRDVDQALADLKASVERDRVDAARMREIDELVGAMAARCPEKRDAAALLSAALLSAAAVEAADDAEVAELRNNPNWTAQSVKRAIIRAAIRAAGVEPVERTQSCPRCDMHAEEAKQLGQTLDDVARAIGRMHEPDGHDDHRASVAEIVARCRELSEAEGDITTEQVAHAKTRKDHESAMRRADQARAEADALRAEVAALRGLSESEAFMFFAKEAAPEVAPWLIREKLEDLFATVPPAKVADAVKHHDLCNCDACLAVKAEAPGLEPLPVIEGVSDFSNWRVAITERVNVLSAIAKRGVL